MNNKPLLPAWATQEDLDNAVNEIIYNAYIAYDSDVRAAKAQSAVLTGEAEAFVTHLRNGW